MLRKTANHQAGTRQIMDTGSERLLIVSAFLVTLDGCGLDVGRDVRAYNTCLSRHPQDVVVVCDGHSWRVSALFPYPHLGEGF
jgi:hypothetical protein